MHWLVGFHGAMLCDFPHFAAGLYLSQMLSGQTRAYPLAPWLLGPFIISITLLAWTTAQLKRNKLFR